MTDQYGFEAKVIEHSVSHHWVPLITIQLRYPRFIHPELMTHRVFSRSASSSRAIPVAKMLEQVRNQPAMPVHWGKNQPGMQAREELSEEIKSEAINAWMMAAGFASDMAERMSALGLHKQVVNRILEPFQFISVIVTATEWDNFFELRDHPDAQPEIRHLAILMKAAIAASSPRLVEYNHSRTGDDDPKFWHLPYVSAEERQTQPADLLCKLSAARCARVSYKNHDGTLPDLNKDLELFERLVGSRPLHASPTEHQATPGYDDFAFYKNFRGWMQFRYEVEGGLK